MCAWVSVLHCLMQYLPGSVYLSACFPTWTPISGQDPLGSDPHLLPGTITLTYLNNTALSDTPHVDYTERERQVIRQVDCVCVKIKRRKSGSTDKVPNAGRE